MQWDLSEIRNLFGDAVTFTYEQELQPVGIGGLEHTEASYLTKITNPQGQSVTLVYEDKISDDKRGVIEYQESHTEAPEPDAYQERYEKRYLDHLVVRDRAHTSDYRYSVHLGYATMGPKDLAKRILTSIERRDEQGVRHVPPVELAYYPAGGRAGKMMLATTSQGPQVEYEYTSINLGGSDRKFIVEAPEGGYAEPQTWIGNNYVVVVWRQLAADGKSHQGSGRKLKLTVYQ